MSKLSYRHNKKTGATYVYSVEESYWNKEKKSPRNKQVYLGKLDPATETIIPAKRRDKNLEQETLPQDITASSRVAGPYLLLEQITRKHELDKLLKKCFPDQWELMLSLVYFIVHKGIALSRSESWSKACLHPFDDSITSQRISKLLREIGEDERQKFLSLWLKNILEKDYLCYDITSISSYARSNEYTSFGYNRDQESLEQINLAINLGKKVVCLLTIVECLAILLMLLH